VTTTARELLHQGNLAAAVERQTQEVKARPADMTARIFLFELLCFAGNFDRAGKQLDVIAHQSTEMEIGTEIYRQVLAAERVRRAVFGAGGSPDFATSPPAYVALHLEALTLAREKHPDKARILLEKALDMHSAPGGTADGVRFQDFADSDVFLSPFLELIVNEKYIWLPFDEIKRIEIIRPAHLRDLLWARAKIEARGGDMGEVFLPALYPGSSEHQADAVKLGRQTEWLEVGAGLAHGAGQRLFAIDGGEKGMLEINEVIFDSNGEAIST